MNISRYDCEVIQVRRDPNVGHCYDLDICPDLIVECYVFPWNRHSIYRDIEHPSEDRSVVETDHL